MAKSLICRFFLCIIWFSMQSGVNCDRGKKGTFSNEWLLEGDFTREDAEILAKNYGLEYSHEVFPRFHVLKMPGLSSSSAPYSLSNRQKRTIEEPKIKSFKQQKYSSHELKGRPGSRDLNITDKYWTEMWYLKPDRVPSMRIYEAWKMGYTGEGIKIAVLDDGLDMGHSDLMENHLEDYSYDYLYYNNYPTHNDNNFHGTWCAGIIAAVKNDECVIGVAYNSKFSSVKIFDSYYGLTPAGDAVALTHELSEFDIYSNSWGPADNGQIYGAAEEVVNAALLKGVTEGRNGKGAIYTWAAGNGGPDDNCNCDGYASSIYTISITSISYDLEAAWYSEPCTSILAGTYGGDVPHPSVSTTDADGGCTSTFYGTSATCPLAAGIIALTLEANPELTWRDVQHLIVETASHENLNTSAFENGAGKEVNNYFGFGLMNAEAMINRSLSWTLVPEQTVCQSANIIVNALSLNGSVVNSSTTSDGCGGTVRFVEHVQARVAFQSVRRGTLQIYLKSPSGFVSQLLTNRPYDFFERLPLDWTFMSVHHWGENPNGEWQLRVETTEPELIFTVSEWQLILYGTSTDPALGRVRAEKLEDDDSKVGAIVGGTVSGIALLAIAIAVVAVLIFCRPPKKVRDSSLDINKSSNNEAINGKRHERF